MSIKEFLEDCYEGLTSLMQGGASLPCGETRNYPSSRARETRCSISPGRRETRPAIRTVAAHQKVKTGCARDGTETADCAVIAALSPALRPPSGPFSRWQQTICVCYFPTIERPVPAFSRLFIEHLAYLPGTPPVGVCERLPKPPSLPTARAASDSSPPPNWQKGGYAVVLPRALSAGRPAR